MTFPGLFHLSVTLILASNSRGQQWDINVSRAISATQGSDVTIPCTFTYPPQYHTNDVQVFWKKPERSNFRINDNDKNAFIFHPNATFVLKKYRGKTKLLGNKAKGNCSLQIQKISENEPNLYLRVIAKGDQYSFKKKFVSISVPGAKQVTVKPDDSFSPSPSYETRTDSHMTQLHDAAIAASVAALLLVLFFVGIAFCIKKKRSMSFARNESGYYANFSRASSDQVQREACCAQQDNKKLCEPKEIDEPVYINVKASSIRTDERMHHVDHIYANMGHSEQERN